MTLKNQDVADAFNYGNSSIASKTLFIEGNVVYSYGHHFPIAIKLEDGKFLFNSDGYSHTTAVHKGRVMSAIGSQNIIAFGTTKQLIRFIESECKSLQEFTAIKL